MEFTALCLVAIGILWWFGRHLNWLEVRQSVARANLYFLGAAIGVVLFSYWCRAVRWGALLAPLSPARLRNLFIATTVGFGAVFVFGRMGEVVRPVVLPMREPRIRPSASFVTIIVERVYDLLAVIVLFAANLLWLRPPPNSVVQFDRVRTAGIILLALAIVAVFALTLFRTNSSVVVNWTRSLLERRRIIPARLTHAIVSVLEQLARALRVLVDARELAVTAGWTVIVWLGIILANFLVLRAFGLHFGVTETIFVMGWAVVGSLVPTPGGAAGAFHAATAGALVFLGVAKETAAAISIVMHLVDFGPALLVGLAYIMRGDINLSNLRAMTSPEAVEHAVEDEEVVPEAFVHGQPETVGARE
jgi:glycosyltransferase 2 family protein